MRDRNSIRLGGTLKSVDRLRVERAFTSIKAVLRHDGVWDVQVFAQGETAKQLALLPLGTPVLLNGHLSRDPWGTLQVVAERIVAGERKREPVDCSHSMDLSVVGYR
ncbi:MAG TPA: hypothetical protein VIH56_06765 [Candidatus Acidoferrales bacterium]